MSIQAQIDEVKQQIRDLEKIELQKEKAFSRRLARNKSMAEAATIRQTAEAKVENREAIKSLSGGTKAGVKAGASSSKDLSLLFNKDDLDFFQILGTNVESLGVNR